METNGNRNDAKWDEFEKMMEDKVVFTVPIDESVKAGVVTSLKGVRAFIPASQLSTSYVEDTSEWIGKEIDVVIITADREKQRLVLSGREAAKIKRSQEKKARIDALAVGTVLEGKVETIKPYGAFVDLGNGISGLVHISQMSTKRVATPEEVCKEGDVVKVKITKVKDGKVSLSMKALEEAPAPAERMTFRSFLLLFLTRKQLPASEICSRTSNWTDCVWLCEPNLRGGTGGFMPPVLLCNWRLAGVAARSIC